MTPWATWSKLASELIGEPELTASDIAVEARVGNEELRRLWQALGFPPVPAGERIFTRSDVAMLQCVRALVERQGTEADVVIQLTRVTGQALARIAEAQIAASADRLAALPGAGVADDPPAEALVARVSVLASSLEPLLGHVWRRHLLAALLRFAATAEDHAGDAGTLAVGFVDLVGFTAFSQQLSQRELAAMVDRFEAVAYAHIPEHGGRVVKTIGDEVMFAVESAPAAAEIALAMVEAYAADATLPDVRVGLAKGPTLSWEGDLFGPTVNLASRLVNLARPRSVLLSAELADELEGRFVLRHLRPLRLHGIGRVRVSVLRRDQGTPPRGG
jgi:adenylate cyclase